MRLCQLLSMCFSLGHGEADTKIWGEVQVIHWRKPLWRMEEGTEQVKGASKCSASRKPVNGWRIGLEDLRLQCNSEKEAVHQVAWHSTSIKSLSVKSLGEAWPRGKCQWIKKCGSWYLLVNMVSLWHILLTGDLRGVLYLPDLTTLRYLEYSKHLKFLSQYCFHFIGKEAWFLMTLCASARITCNQVKT